MFSFFFLLFSSFLHPFPPSSGSQGQFPLTQNVTVVEGGTANLTCRVDQNDNTSLQWSNPVQQTLYFDDKKGKLFPELMLLHCFFIRKKRLKPFLFYTVMWMLFPYILGIDFFRYNYYVIFLFFLSGVYWNTLLHIILYLNY